MSKIDIAAEYLIKVANDNTNGYSQPRRGQGKEDDCSSGMYDALKIADFEVGPVIWTTATMLLPLLSIGFKNIASSINLHTGEGLQIGDILLRPKTDSLNGHVAMYIGNGKIVQFAGDYDGKAGDSSGREISIKDYYDSPFKYVLRYTEEDKALFAIKVVDDTWTHKSPDGEVSSRDHIALAEENLTLGIAETSGTWGRIQNKTLWISINPDYAGVQRVGDAVPPVAPKTIAVGSRYTLSGTGTGSSDGMGTRVTKTNVEAKCTKIMPGAKNPYGMCWTGGTWVDAWFSASAIK